MNLKQFRSKLLTDKEFTKEFCKPHLYEFVLLRNKLGVTQKQLAERIDTEQPSVSRVEVGGETTLDFVGKMAYALGYVARLQFTPLKDYKLEQMEEQK